MSKHKYLSVFYGASEKEKYKRLVIMEVVSIASASGILTGFLYVLS